MHFNGGNSRLTWARPIWNGFGFYWETFSRTTAKWTLEIHKQRTQPEQMWRLAVIERGVECVWLERPLESMKREIRFLKKMRCCTVAWVNITQFEKDWTTQTWRCSPFFHNRRYNGGSLRRWYFDASKTPNDDQSDLANFITVVCFARSGGATSSFMLKNWVAREDCCLNAT